MKEERVGNIAQWNKIRQIDEREEGSVGQPYKEAENRPQGVTRSRGEKETRGGEQRAEVGRHSLRGDVGTILDEYDTEGVKYPTINYHTIIPTYQATQGVPSGGYWHTQTCKPKKKVSYRGV